MEPYRIVFTRAAHKELADLPDAVGDRITAAIERLGKDPRGAGTKKLKAYGGRWRLRVGDYRVVYSIDDQGRLIIVSIIRHRREVYRDS